MFCSFLFHNNISKINNHMYFTANLKNWEGKVLNTIPWQHIQGMEAKLLSLMLDTF
jgi:hypothetical protein